MNGDGNGWAAGPGGVKVWGRYGAAGLLLLAEPDATGVEVLMQHRAPWTNAGDTWALPGGARDSHESTAEAALREAIEECSLDPSLIDVLHEEITAGPFPADPDQPELAGDWTYTTVIARTRGGRRLLTHANEESLELRWVPLDELDSLPLMPAFQKALPGLREIIADL
ncbi:NUDIX hydrolase [Corynebacterium halotolerans]|uniref:Mutator MutT3 n=1 Tax=Corynebacterium halotolerans YIM 70093 = DSM 44683 TaxID=1121362 RepID=M1N0R8_9CORY|nr:NUDIX hydrolase [Corynebacterium halotolerans]AGF73494.1 mutator MutT3 [Corynebacterium halotolerans YIM 70093 = DSM 44683]